VSRVTYEHKSRHEQITSRIEVMCARVDSSHISLINDMYHHFCTWRDLFVTWFMFIRDTTHLWGTWTLHIGHDLFICDMTLSSMCRDSFVHLYSSSVRHRGICVWKQESLLQKSPIKSRRRAPVCASSVTHINESGHMYGVATIGRLLKIIGLFCQRAL